MNLFNDDSKIIQSLQTFGGLIILNICYILCCIPVITAGAATIALYTVTLNEADSRSGSASALFFKVFRSEFQKSIKLWLLLLFMGAVIVYNFIFLYANPQIQSGLFRGILISVTVIYAMIMTYIFPISARYENSLLAALRNSLALAAGNLPMTVLMVLINSIPLLILLFSIRVFILISVFLVFFYFSVAARINSAILVRIFRKLDKET
ncbi:MAG: YesL family protein [Lachnospiraceae bacterium]|nr:YesL family protein [Lachnospiraceae bacterium]